MHLFEKENDIVLKKSTKYIKVHAKRRNLDLKQDLMCTFVRFVLKRENWTWIYLEYTYYSNPVGNFCAI